MSVETKSGRIDTHTQNVRRGWRKALGIPFRTESNRNFGITDAAAHMLNGGGLIVYANHFDRPDPLHVLFALYDQDESLAERKMVIPIADHQKMASINLIGRSKSAGLTIKPLVTERSASKYDAHKEKIRRGNFLRRVGPLPTPDPLINRLLSEYPPEHAGYREFADAAVEGLDSNSIIYLPVQPERSPILKTPQQKERSLGLLVSLAKKHEVDIDKIGILFVGVSLPGVGDHSGKTGMNLFRTHTVKPGRFVKLEDALRRAGGVKQLDAWATEQVANLVPYSMLSGELQSVIDDKNRGIIKRGRGL